MTENPATNEGVSIGLGWSYIQQDEELLDVYQERRPPLRSSFLIGKAEREELLLDLGYTRSQLAASMRQIKKLRNQRRQTVVNMKAEKVEEALQGAGKKVKRLFGFEKDWYSSYKSC